MLVLLVWLLQFPVEAATPGTETVYFGQDLSAYRPFGPNQVLRPNSRPNSDSAAASFFARLQGVTTETFESFAPGSVPSQLVFGTNTVTVTGGQGIVEVPDSTTTINGEFPISGTKGLELIGDSGTGFFALDFASAQAAFGFYATDIELNGLNVTLIETSGTNRVLNVPVSIPQGTAGTLFWGVIDAQHPFSRVELSRTGNLEDGFLFDNLTSASPSQVKPDGPLLSINDVTVLEGADGNTPVVFTVALSAATDREVSVDFATTDGTAVAPGDYQAAQGSLAFAPSTAAAPAPTLSTFKFGGQVAIAWPVGYETYQLQSVQTLSADSAWALAPDVPAATQGGARVTIAPRETSAFYRLSRPLIFGPGEVTNTITVWVRGDTIVEPDEVFYVDLTNASNATVIKARGVATIKNDDTAPTTNQPPVVRITSPENNATFLPGSDIVISATAADPDGAVAQVEFFAGAALIGVVTNAPYSTTWTHETALGSFELTAKATDNQGATASSTPVVIKVADVVADVAIVRNFDAPEIEVLGSYLFELGLTYFVFDQETATFDAIKDFKLIIWDDLGEAAGGLRDADVDLFERAYQSGIPLYFIGQRLVSSSTNLSVASRGLWNGLIHLESASTPNGNGDVTILTAPNHPVINGRFGAVEDFSYSANLDPAVQTGAASVLLATAGDSAVLLADEDPVTGVRTVTQDFLPTLNESGDPSLEERHRLFLNAVWWLLRRPLCGLTDLAVSETAPATAQVGNPLTFTVTVQRSGECEPTGVVATDVLPAGVTFVSAETPLGTWSESAGTVTFHLGLLEEVRVPLSMTVIPTQPGSITNTVRVRCNEREQNLGNNAATLTVIVAP